jgi:hypothetical protein
LSLNHPLPHRTHNAAYPGVDYAEGKRSDYKHKSATVPGEYACRYAREPGTQRHLGPLHRVGPQETTPP